MKAFFVIISITGLLLLLIPSLMHYFQALDLDHMKNLMFLGTLIWFAGAIPWLGRKVRR